MRAYVWVEPDYGGFTLHGVYTTRELAEQAMSILAGFEGHVTRGYIEERTVDVMPTACDAKCRE